jgi:AraC family transcriptional regulator
LKKTLSPAEIPDYVPGENWLACELAAQPGLAVRGYTYAPSDIRTPGLTDALIVIYLAGSARMTRRVAGATEHKTVAPGQISLMARRNDVSWSWDEPIRVLHLYLAPALLEGVARHVFPGQPHDIELRNELELADPVLHRIGCELADGSALDGPGADLYAQALTQQICIHVLRRYVERPRPDVSWRGSLSVQQTRRILELLDGASAAQMSLAKLAAEIGVSEGHFIRLFKARFGVAPHQYVVKRRLEHGKELLSSDMNLAQVAAASGFSDQSHFTRVFKREFHMTPSAWRRGR